jgi:hypothetical protein
MPRNTSRAGIAVIGIDIGKNIFHVVGHDKFGAIVPRQKWSQGQGPSERRHGDLPTFQSTRPRTSPGRSRILGLQAKSR